MARYAVLTRSGADDGDSGFDVLAETGEDFVAVGWGCHFGFWIGYMEEGIEGSGEW
jgi:hypothetical protein